MTRSILPLCLLLGSCSVFEAISGEPTREPEVGSDEHYLAAGPNTNIELGQDERTLLEDYKKLNDTKLQLETRLGEMQAENEQLRAQLVRTEEERDRFRNELAGQSQEGERLGQRARDLESKVLSLTIEKTLVEQELLRLRISSLRDQYEDLVAAPQAAPPAGGAR